MLPVATQASEQFVVGDRFAAIRFGNPSLEFGEFFRREADGLLRFPRDDKYVSAVSDGRVVQDDLACDNSACSNSHVAMLLRSA